MFRQEAGTREGVDVLKLQLLGLGSGFGNLTGFPHASVEMFSSWWTSRRGGIAPEPEA